MEETECANSQYSCLPQAKPDKPKGESGFSFLHVILHRVSMSTGREGCQTCLQLTHVAYYAFLEPQRNCYPVTLAAQALSSSFDDLVDQGCRKSLGPCPLGNRNSTLIEYEAHRLDERCIARYIEHILAMLHSISYNLAQSHAVW